MYGYLILTILFCTECYDKDKSKRDRVESKRKLIIPNVSRYSEDRFISDVNYKGADLEDVGLKVGLFGRLDHNIIHLLKSIAIDKSGELVRRSGDDDQIYSAKVSHGVVLLSLGHSGPILIFEPYFDLSDSSKIDDYTISQSLIVTSYSTSDDKVVLQMSREEFGLDSISLTNSGQKAVVDVEFHSRDYICPVMNFKIVDEQNYDSEKLINLISSNKRDKEVKFVKKYKSERQTKDGLRPIEISIDESDNRLIEAQLAALTLDRVTIMGDMGVAVLDGLNDLKTPFTEIEGEEIANQVYIVPDLKNSNHFLCYVTILFKGNLLKLTYRMGMK